MNEMRIAVPNNAFSKNEVLIAELKSHFSDVIINEKGERLAGDELISFLDGADGVIVGLEDFNSKIIDACPSIKIIAKYGVGLNNIDLDHCKKRGIKIGWEAGVNKLSVAEMAVGYMLMLCRNLYTTSNQLKHEVWNKSGGSNLSGKTIGIVGVGHIGKELIRLLKPFSCRVLVNDIVEQSDYYSSAGVKHVSKDEIYCESDIISLHTPLTKETYKLIDAAILAKMKPSSILLNTARGELIDLEALKEALLNKSIGGAAIDVYYEEPPQDFELLKIENLINTPHIGGNSMESVLAMGRSSIKSLLKYKKADL